MTHFDGREQKSVCRKCMVIAITHEAVNLKPTRGMPSDSIEKSNKHLEFRTAKTFLGIIKLAISELNANLNKSFR